MVHAICARCGSSKADFSSICSACGHRPTGRAVALAWLLSDHNLSQHDLAGAAERIRNQEPLNPNAAALRRARLALGWHVATDPGLSQATRALLAITSVLLTPAPGFMVAWHWWEERPRSAWQALSISLPIAALLTIFFAWRAWGDLLMLSVQPS